MELSDFVGCFLFFFVFIVVVCFLVCVWGGSRRGGSKVSLLFWIFRLFTNLYSFFMLWCRFYLSGSLPYNDAI